MDPTRFDALARGLGEPRSRRRVVALLLGLAAGGAPAAASGKRRKKGNGGAAKECRFPGVACKSGKECCEDAACDGGFCQCKPGFIQCGDYCLTEALADNFGCCKPYKTPCGPDDPLVCCGASTCTGTLDGQTVCCGLEIHPCTKATQAYCCSGVCGANGRCLPAAAGEPEPRG